MTATDDAHVIAGVLAAGFRNDDNGFATLLELLDRDVRRLLYALAELDGALLRTVAEKAAEDVPSVVDAVAGSLEATKFERAGRSDAWPADAWDAAAIVLQTLGTAVTASKTTTMNKPPDVEGKRGSPAGTSSRGRSRSSSPSRKA